MAKVKLPDGRVVEAKAGSRILDAIPPGSGLVARVNGRLVDLTTRIEEDWGVVEVLDFGSEEGRKTYWHTTAHILAQAVKRLFPQAKLGIGPATDSGFYYDFDLGGYAFTAEDIERIEGEMRRIIEEDIPIERVELGKEEAQRLFEERGEVYKLELLSEIPDPTVTVYRQAEFVDLCRGPHLPSTGYVKAFKITSVSSAYWRGDERNPAMQRVYGVSFPSEDMLKKHLEVLEEAKRRDHRVLGPKLDLFSMPADVIGPGFVLWHPKGALARVLIENFLREIHLRSGYQLVITPHVARSGLWETSGHLSYYRDMMYVFEKDGVPHVIKPMNCPFHILIYKSRVRSYRELPIRYFELGTVYRYERSGTLHGLLRARGFTQDDAHIFCRRDQLEDEIVGVLTLMERILSAFGFTEYEVGLSTRDPEHPEEYMGSDEIWEHAQEALARALERKGYEYREMPGEAAFYGPKIDVKLVDSLGRKWQCTTIQVDFNLPERFNVTYVDKDGTEKRVVMIHRALLGSIERFFGILVEHYAGELPLWCAPVQARVVPISDKYLEYAEKVYRDLAAAGVRVELDAEPSPLSYKIRKAEVERVPYILVVGKREAESGTVSVRRRRKGSLGSMKVEEFAQMVLREGRMPL